MASNNGNREKRIEDKSVLEVMDNGSTALHSVIGPKCNRRCYNLSWGQKQF